MTPGYGEAASADEPETEEPAVRMLKAFLWVPAAIAATAVLFWMQYRIRMRRLKHILSSASPEDRIKKIEIRIEKLEKCSGIEVKIPEPRLLYELWQEAAFSCHSMTEEDADKAFQYAGACGKFVETRQSKCGTADYKVYPTAVDPSACRR